MTSSSSVVPLRQPDAIDHPLTAVLRSGARRLLAQAIGAEADAFLATMKGMQLPDGRDRLALLPILYLRGVSMGDFQEALAALLGKDAPNHNGVEVINTPAQSAA